MDFVKLVHEGPYSYDELSEKGKAYIDGMRAAQRSLENFKFSLDPADDGILAQAVNEIQTKTVNEALDWMEASICEAIVATADHEIEDAIEELPF